MKDFFLNLSKTTKATLITCLCFLILALLIVGFLVLCPIPLQRVTNIAQGRISETSSEETTEETSEIETSTEATTTSVTTTETTTTTTTTTTDVSITPPFENNNYNYAYDEEETIIYYYEETVESPQEPEVQETQAPVQTEAPTQPVQTSPSVETPTENDRVESEKKVNDDMFGDDSFD